ncbi:4'-phosphopantetheinyl transferase superfamily protein [Vibrio sp. OCN044]|uniref:Enterobactin synthase component D n=1 Tax=Vibrio tetraodonis subsp. pristinus TaxID=2695891 RepID=A0A6L8LVZ0_9VIBR|nr:4'-phosphopantetheinyl transferase superfamily protein [Vibrio tetraodonis]MYM60271.1 4'-phosphopantetheinyl transferase superfamily protein [Vibrio tetraodonis subsp. pristinus]
MNSLKFLFPSRIGLLGLPDTIEVQHTGFDINAYYQSLFDHYQVDFPASLGKAVDKRCAEYLAGRIVARKAIERINGTTPQIGTHKDRSPIWPQGLIGSITHSDGVVIAAVAEQKHHRLLGIDFEHWMSAQLADELCDQLLDQSEKQLLLQSDLAFERGVTLIFSLKESFYKALYPHVNTFFGFDEARVRSIDTTNGAFIIELLTSFGKEYQQGWSTEGYFRVLSDGVLTYIYE